jgi:hypothetical protein
MGFSWELLKGKEKGGALRRRPDGWTGWRYFLVEEEPLLPVLLPLVPDVPLLPLVPDVPLLPLVPELPLLPLDPEPLLPLIVEPALPMPLEPPRLLEP